MCTDNNKNSNAVSFALGAMLGAGAGMLLSTKKGRRLVKQTWRKVEPFVGEAVDSAKDEFEEVKDKAREVKVRAEDEVERTISQVKDFANQKIPANLKKPIKKAFFKGV